jgi:hypothetical protein
MTRAFLRAGVLLAALPLAAACADGDWFGQRADANMRATNQATGAGGVSAQANPGGTVASPLVSTPAGVPAAGSGLSERGGADAAVSRATDVPGSPPTPPLYPPRR